MPRIVRIANAQAFWGDRNDAASDLLKQAPELDYLTLDYLAEVSLSILAQQQIRNPAAGFPRDFLEAFSGIIPHWKAGSRCKLITNAGGLDPHACAEACAQRLKDAGCRKMKIGVVTGDAVLDQLMDVNHPDAKDCFRHLESKMPIATVHSRLVTANAYLGAAPIIEALRAGAEIVITGRVADPSLTLAACVHEFNWDPNDWDRLAAGTVAGHLIECGVQVTGGISTDWLSVPNPTELGFPIVEMEEDGSFVVTKPQGTGGAVTINTVSEQLVYEIGDPGRYLSPDLTVSFLNLHLETVGEDRVRVTGARGFPPTTTYKVSATYRDGYRAAGLLTIFGRDAMKKAHRCGEIVLERMRAEGLTWRDSIVECIGAGACADGVFRSSEFDSLREVAFRIALEADDQDVVNYFTRQIIPLVTSGPQGTTGYAEGRPRVHPIFRYWPCLIHRDHVHPKVEYIDVQESENPTLIPKPSMASPKKSSTSDSKLNTSKPSRTEPRVLGDIAFARSGDKGTAANIGVISREKSCYSEMCNWLTADRVAAFLSPLGVEQVERFELPNLHALNFVVHGILSRGLRCDAQGKALGQVLLEMPLDLDQSARGGQ